MPAAKRQNGEAKVRLKVVFSCIKVKYLEFKG